MNKPHGIAAGLYKAGWRTVLPASYTSSPLIDYGRRVSRQDAA